jgi:hypothetical protein
VLRTVGGGDIEADVDAGLSIARDGRRIVFTSASARLFRGDANERADAFAIRRDDDPPAEEAPPPEPPLEPEAGTVGVLPEEPEPPRGRLTVFVRRAPLGRVRLLVRAPAPGDVEVGVRGRLPGRNGRPRGSAVLLAAKGQEVKRRGDALVTLAIRRDRLAALRRAGRLDGQAEVLFTTLDGAEYERRIAVTFRPPKAKRRPAAKRRRSAARRRSTSTREGAANRRRSSPAKPRR